MGFTRRNLIRIGISLPVVACFHNGKMAPELPRNEECKIFWGLVRYGIDLGSDWLNEDVLDLVNNRTDTNDVSTERAREIVYWAYHGAYSYHDLPEVARIESNHPQ